MTRLEMIKLLVGQARLNGFQLKRWYIQAFGLPWQNAQHACEMLAAERRYFVLLFSHDFAMHFWKPGEPITFTVDKQVFQRNMPDGSVRTVMRKPYTRRSGRPDAWKYHLRELAMAEEPLRYMRRYLRVEDDLEVESLPAQEKPALKQDPAQDYPQDFAGSTPKAPLARASLPVTAASAALRARPLRDRPKRPA